MGKKKTYTKQPIKKGSSLKRSIIKTMWIAFAGAISLIVILFGLIAVGAIGYLPPIDQLETLLTNMHHNYTHRTVKY